MEEVTVTVDIVERKRRRSAASIVWSRVEEGKKQETKMASKYRFQPSEHAELSSDMH